MKSKSPIPVQVPLLLTLPAFFLLVYSLCSAWAKGMVPTGFIQYDLAYYVANARQHFDEGLRLTNGNPYATYGTPAIYFQPHILLLGIPQKPWARSRRRSEPVWSRGRRIRRDGGCATL